jgi:hypothetical protein
VEVAQRVVGDRLNSEENSFVLVVYILLLLKVEESEGRLAFYLFITSESYSFLTMSCFIDPSLQCSIT